jgi:hypothetical protein
MILRTRFPLRLVNPCNRREHWRVVSKRSKSELAITGMMLRTECGSVPPQLPVVVTITRVGPGKMDDDNLASAAKHVRDGVAKWMGVDDGDARYTWRYAQRSDGRGVYAVEVVIDAP